MDRVLVMDGGRLVEDGKPRDLLRSGPGPGGGSSSPSYYRAAIDKDGPTAVQVALQVAEEWDAKRKSKVSST